MTNNKFLHLRNQIHDGKFRFHITPDLWKRHYIPGGIAKPNKIHVITKNGKLMGYAVYSQVYHDGTKACRILDICAKEEKNFRDLINQIIKNCIKENVDFIYLTKCDRIYDKVLDDRGFLSVEQSVIMVMLLNPHELFSSLSEKIESGKIFKLIIHGFKPITMRVDKKAINVIGAGNPDLVITTDSETFLRLFFGRTVLWKELLKRKVTISNPLRLPAATHFFNLIRERNWYIPHGDW